MVNVSSILTVVTMNKEIKETVLSSVFLFTLVTLTSVSYTHLTLPTTPYV